jgi:hypothetical protein
MNVPVVRELVRNGGRIRRDPDVETWENEGGTASWGSWS